MAIMIIYLSNIWRQKKKRYQTFSFFQNVVWEHEKKKFANSHINIIIKNNQSSKSLNGFFFFFCWLFFFRTVSCLHVKGNYFRLKISNTRTWYELFLFFLSPSLSLFLSKTNFLSSTQHYSSLITPAENLIPPLVRLRVRSFRGR